MRFVVLAILTFSTAAVAADVSADPPRTIVLTVSQWQIVWDALGERPAKIVVPVMNDIQRQINLPAAPPTVPQSEAPR